MNLSTLKREVVYLVEDELQKKGILSYDGYQDDIRELLTFFLDQRVDYNEIPKMIIEMFLNPPEVYFIKQDGTYDSYKLSATELHQQAIFAYSFQYLSTHPEDQELEKVFHTASVNDMMRSLYERGITIMRVFHNAIVGESFAVTTPIPDTEEKVKETYEKLKEKLIAEKNGNIKFETCSLENFDYNFVEDMANNHKK